MNADTFWHLVGLASSAMGGTWVLRKELSAIRSALEVHIAENKSEHKEMNGKIIELKQQKRRR